MASPVDADRIGTNISTAADPWSVTLPTGIAAGQLLVMFLRTGGTQTVNTPSGWSLQRSSALDNSDDNSYFFYRLADGSETSPLSVDLSASAKGAAIVHRITGAIDPSTQAPESTETQFTSGNVTPVVITPTGGSKDYLFIVWAGMDGETQTYTQPANYSNLTQANSGTGGAAATNVRVASASRELTASSEDPGDWTNADPTTAWTSFTVAIHPSPAAGINQGDQSQPLLMNLSRR